MIFFAEVTNAIQFAVPDVGGANHSFNDLALRVAALNALRYRQQFSVCRELTDRMGIFILTGAAFRSQQIHRLPLP
ncbi:hypothetical protein D3C78_1674980 [compost metagenome]